jgi:hypothetical protein
MKVSESTVVPSNLFEKEVRKLTVLEVTLADVPQLFELMGMLDAPKYRKYEMQLDVAGMRFSVGKPDDWWAFRCGFKLAMKLHGIDVPNV